MKKTLQQSEDLYIQFTPEELNSLGMQVGDKFSCKIENGTIKLNKYVKVEIDMENWPKDLLLYLIKTSAEQDISTNDVIRNIMEQQIIKTSDV